MKRVRVSLDTPTGLVELNPGSYVIGRDPECDVVLWSGRASRRHARVVVEESSATLEDLGAANGTFVNGSPLRGRRALADADFIVIGDIVIEVAITTVTAEKSKGSLAVAGTARADTSAPAGHPAAPHLVASAESSRGQTQGRDWPPAPAPAPRPTPTQNLETIPARAYEVLEATAEPFFAEQQLSLAEKILEGWLTQVLVAVKIDAPREEDGDATALRQGARLAHTLMSSRWLDYTVELAAELRVPLGSPELDALEPVVRRVGASERLLDAYLVSLRGLRPSDLVHACIRRIETWRSHASQR